MIIISIIIVSSSRSSSSSSSSSSMSIMISSWLQVMYDSFSCIGCIHHGLVCCSCGCCCCCRRRHRRRCCCCCCVDAFRGTFPIRPRGRQSEVLAVASTAAVAVTVSIGVCKQTLVDTSNL